MPIYLNDLVNDPGIIVWDDKDVQKCCECNRPLQSFLTGKESLGNGLACTDCFYRALGEMIEQSPIVRGSPPGRQPNAGIVQWRNLFALFWKAENNRLKRRTTKARCRSMSKQRTNLPYQRLRRRVKTQTINRHHLDEVRGIMENMTPDELREVLGEVRIVFLDSGRARRQVAYLDKIVDDCFLRSTKLSLLSILAAYCFTANPANLLRNRRANLPILRLVFTWENPSPDFYCRFVSAVCRNYALGQITSQELGEHYSFLRSIAAFTTGAKSAASARTKLIRLLTVAAREMLVKQGPTTRSRHK